MYISGINEINNYRNLTGKNIKFDKNLNFIVGENNIGKTNILELLNICLCTGKFSEIDFYNVLDPIIIRFTIEYDDDEIGFFDDYFDIENSHQITLIAKQDTIDERIVYHHVDEDGSIIKPSIIRKMNVLYYYSQRMPSREVDFRKNNGSAKVLNYLIQHSLDSLKIEEKDILKQTKLKKVIKDVNAQIENINSVTGDKINVYLDKNIDKIISRILNLGDQNEIQINELGEGIQYSFNILLQIISIIYNVQCTRKSEDFKARLIDKNGCKYFPLFLMLDEPEVHQHPYRQRNLIKKIEELMKNKNVLFVNLLNELFGIDGIVGQVFIVTHSPNILLNDYKQFIRVYYSKNKNIEIISGSNLEIQDTLYRHLYHNFFNLKEAMFSKGIIFVEGDTEAGALPVFAQRMMYDLDEIGVGVVKLDGADGVKKFMKIYEQFGIISFAIIDRDKKERYSKIKNVYFTYGNDFEEDIYDSFLFVDYMKYNNKIGKINGFVNKLKEFGIVFDVTEYKLNPNGFKIDNKLQLQLKERNKNDELKVLRKEKNAYKASILAEYVSKIPTSFTNVIDKIIKEVK